MEDQQGLIDYLLQFLNENRRELLFRDINLRSKHLTLVLEDFYHPHNISATIRTADSFGLSDIHVIENKIRYENNPNINKGSDKWVTLNRYKEGVFNSPACIEKLKAEGYRIVATSPHQGSVTIRELDITVKTAIVMGAESYGVSDYVRENADAFLKIEMPGFTESLNVSVAAGIILETLTHRIRSGTVSWGLTPEEKQEVLLLKLSRLITDSHLLKRIFFENQEAGSKVLFR